MLLTNHFPSSTTPPPPPHARIPSSTELHHHNSSPPPPLVARASPSLPSSRRPSLDPASRSLHPLPSFRHHPYSQPDHRAAAASDSRRSSLASIVSTATNTSSSPSSPPNRRRSPSVQYQYQYRSPESDPLSRFHANTLPPPSQQSPPSPLHNPAVNSNGVEPWRRDSLPSISQITRFRDNTNDTEMSMSSTTGNNEPSSSTSSSNAMWLDEPVSSQPQHPAIVSPADNMRRHSVAITSSARYNPRQNGGGGGVVTPSLRRSSLARMRQPDDESEQLTTRERAGSSSSAYSRSPELRISHKLAERKRRKEMNDLFDELRDILPVEKGLKTSKWEILSKALEYIATLRERETQWTQEKDQLHRELASLQQHPSSSSASSS